MLFLTSTLLLPSETDIAVYNMDSWIHEFMCVIVYLWLTGGRFNKCLEGSCTLLSPHRGTWDHSTGLNNEALTRRKRGVHCSQVRWIQGRPARAATLRNCARSKPQIPRLTLQASEAASSVPERVKCSRAPSEWQLWAMAVVYMYGVLDFQQMMPMQHSSCGKARSHVDIVIAAARKGLCKGLGVFPSQSRPADPCNRICQ